MENKTTPLERKLEKEIKTLDWKEWVPLYGAYKAGRNILKGETSLSGV